MSSDDGTYDGQGAATSLLTDLSAGVDELLSGGYWLRCWNDC